jgi:hypothetical protein
MVDIRAGIIMIGGILKNRLVKILIIKFNFFFPL